MCSWPASSWGAVQDCSEQVTDVKWLSMRALEHEANFFVNGLECSCEEWAFSSVGLETSAFNRAERCCNSYIIPGPIGEQHYVGESKVSSEVLPKIAGETLCRFKVTNCH